GLDNAGKTTIVKKFNGEDINSISPTLGFSIQTLEHMGYKLNVWDVGGQKSLRSYWRNYFETTDALIWVVDSTDRLRLNDCRDELSNLLQEERLTGATLLVFANKQVSHTLFQPCCLLDNDFSGCCARWSNPLERRLIRSPMLSPTRSPWAFRNTLLHHRCIPPRVGVPHLRLDNPSQYLVYSDSRLPDNHILVQLTS
ncbi:ADP-ribosylation factor-like protein 2, partial [Paragonimus westermani]